MSHVYKKKVDMILRSVFKMDVMMVTTEEMVRQFTQGISLLSFNKHSQIVDLPKIYRGGYKSGARKSRPTLGPNSFIFM